MDFLIISIHNGFAEPPRTKTTNYSVRLFNFMSFPRMTLFPIFPHHVLAQTDGALIYRQNDSCISLDAIIITETITVVTSHEHRKTSVDKMWMKHGNKRNNALDIGSSLRSGTPKSEVRIRDYGLTSQKIKRSREGINGPSFFRKHERCPLQSHQILQTFQLLGHKFCIWKTTKDKKKFL